ncbi:efflux RND transporter permease subunit [Archangium lipolyticum]|uniref:efflux RND transporter permease subunit n=1 Tax=Archangium lipolyticum TaxID=2970465 RepID=UPI00214A95DF|nr:MMPL family transporter [Archangium lipolyticum]
MSAASGGQEHSFPERLAGWLYTHPRTVAALLAGLLLASAGSLPFLEMESGLDPFFDRTSPLQADLDSVNGHFVNDELIYVAYRTDDVFSRTSLEQVRALSEALQHLRLPGGEAEFSPVDKVTSLTHVKDLVGDADGFRTVPLVPEPTPEDPAALAALRERARRNPLIHGGLLSDVSPTVGALSVRLVDGLDDAQKAALVAEVRRLLAQEEQRGPTRFFLTGDPVIDADVAYHMQVDLERFVPIVYALVVVLLWMFSRRVPGVLLALANVTGALLVGMAALTWVGGSINNLSTILPPVMMVLGVANIIHFLSEWARNAREETPERAPVRTLAELLVPVFMCDLTTAVGFIALSVSPTPAMREFGIAAALAVMLSMVVTFLVLPLASRLRPASWYIRREQVRTPGWLDAWMAAYIRWVFRHPRWLVAASVFIVLIAGAGLLRLTVNEDNLEQFGEGTTLRQHTAFVEEHLGGTTQIVVSIRAEEPERFLEPAELRKLEALDAFLRREVGADHVTSLVDHVKLLHREFDEGRPESFRIPDTREQVAQLLQLDGDESLGEAVDASYQWVRGVARVREHGSTRLQELYERVNVYLQEHFPAREGYHAMATGQGRLWLEMTDNIVGSQVNSLALSFLLIFGPIFLVFRSVRAGLFTIPSNLFPIVCVMGWMGWTGIPLSLSTTMTSSVVLGIAVDDTLHFIQYMRERLRAHGNPERALAETLSTKGLGALWIALVLGVGMSVVVVSSFSPTRYFGLLTALAMVAGLVGELLLLPPLLLVTRTRLGVETPPQPGEPVLGTTSSTP